MFYPISEVDAPYEDGEYKISNKDKIKMLEDAKNNNVELKPNSDLMNFAKQIGFQF